MTLNGWLQFFVYFIVLLLCMRPLGIYMTGVYSGKYNFLSPLENLLYRVSGIHRDEEMNWREYTVAMLLFSFVSLLLTYFFERFQHFLPWNPQHLPGVVPSSPGIPPPPSPPTPTGKPIPRRPP